MLAETSVATKHEKIRRASTGSTHGLTFADRDKADAMFVVSTRPLTLNRCSHRKHLIFSNTKRRSAETPDIAVRT